MHQHKYQYNKYNPYLRICRLGVRIDLLHLHLGLGLGSASLVPSDLHHHLRDLGLRLYQHRLQHHQLLLHHAHLNWGFNTIQKGVKYNREGLNTIIGMKYNTIQFNTIQFNTIQFNSIQYTRSPWTLSRTICPARSADGPSSYASPCAFGLRGVNVMGI
jgi:hypothetical protein